MTDEVYIREPGVDDCEHLEVCEHACRMWCRAYKPRVDRDALRELAVELELGAQRAGGREWSSPEAATMERHLAEDYRTIARRIKKALGSYDKEED